MTPYFLTPTGGRPEGLALLAEYIDGQSHEGPGKWIVVDDCDPASYVPETRFETEVIRPNWRWRPGMNTQARSMAALLARVPDDATVLVFEDDEIYLPGHIENLLAELETADLVGERVSRYYNVASARWKLMPGNYHASLATVGVKGEALALLRDICRRGSRRLDMELWGQYEGPKRLIDTANVIGCKAMPGRNGIGVGHRPTFGEPDTTGVLRQWAGDYADNYEIFRATR